MSSSLLFLFLFCFNDTATTEIYTLSLHDALPICLTPAANWRPSFLGASARARPFRSTDRKSTRLNSSHLVISYHVFCLKKRKTQTNTPQHTNPTPPRHHTPTTTHHT